MKRSLPSLPLPDVAEGAIENERALAGQLARLRNREVGALDELYACSVDRLFALASRIAGDARDAEEVVADVYQYVWEHASDFDAGRGTVLAWLSMLTWSRATDRRRRRRPEVDLGALHPDTSAAAYRGCEVVSSPDAVEAFVDGHRVRKALMQLRAEQRRLILMAFFEGASHGEIAARTDLPLGTIKSHIRRGMESLRLELERGSHGE